MTQRREPWTYGEVLVNFTAKAANYLGRRYGAYVERDDIHQEIFLWAYGEGKAKIERWLVNTPQQTTRIYRSMLDAGIDYAEKEKAEKLGYRVDDVAWYSPGQVEDLIPLALDEDYVRPKGQVDDKLAAVIDVRRAIVSEDLDWFFVVEDDTHQDYKARVQQVVNRLNGGMPYRRRAMSNAQAQAITKNQTEG